MESIKNFDSFMKKAQPKPKKVEEEFMGNFKRKRAEKKALKKASQGSTNVRGTKGKETFVDSSGTKHKVIWKSQDTANFVVKLVNDYDWLDASSNLTPEGQNALLNFLNNETAFLNVYGKLDDTFFKTKVLAYSVKIDNDRKQKIQFTVVEKSYLIGLGMDETILSTQKFINATMISDPKVKQNQDNIIDNIPLPIVPIIDPTVTPEEEEEKEEIIEPEVDESLIGKKFEYQSGNDNKIYFVEIFKGDTTPYKFYAKAKDGSNEGWVTYEGEDQVMWTGKNGIPSPINNAKDRAFFLRIYTDIEYLKELIRMFEEKYPDGGDFSIKNILYYMDGKNIYPAEEAGPRDITLI
tara:strand:+ start:17511 stop:18563 length:1053 start_codon:yes stop_codon:yes gene_type:complete